MAGTIKGITIEIGGSTTKLQDSLKGVNSTISSTNSELREVNKLLKFDPTNTELLSQKQKLLSQNIEATKSKLLSLKDAEKQVQVQMKNGKASEDQYRELQREIIKTEGTLKSLEKQAANSNVTMEKVGTIAGKVADKTKKLSVAAGGTLVALGASAIKAGQSADDLNTLSKQTGITTSELQKMQYAADIVDVSVDTITGAMRKMKKNMDSNSKDTQEAWNRIGVSVTDSAGQMKNSNDIFYETVQALSKVGNETERDQLAMTIFGKSADELAGIIDDGGESLKKLGVEAEDAGLIMSQDALDGANEFNDGIDKLKATANASFGKIAGKLATALIPILEKVSSVISDLLSYFTNLSPTAQKVIIGIIALIAAISPIAKIIQGITAVMGIMNAVAAASPITWIVLGIVAAIAALIAIIVICVKHWDSIKAAAAAAWEWIKGVWESASTWFMDNVVSPIGNFFTGLWDGLIYGAKMAWWGIETGVLSMANFVITIINSMISNALLPLNLAIKGLNHIPGINLPKIEFAIPKFTLPPIPQLATGGILRNGQAIVAEAGPELISMINGETIVQPLTDNARNKSVSSGTQIIHTHVMLDGKQVGYSVSEHSSKQQAFKSKEVFA